MPAPALDRHSALRQHKLHWTFRWHSVFESINDGGTLPVAAIFIINGNCEAMITWALTCSNIVRSYTSRIDTTLDWLCGHCKSYLSLRAPTTALNKLTLRPALIPPSPLNSSPTSCDSPLQRSEKCVWNDLRLSDGEHEFRIHFFVSSATLLAMFQVKGDRGRRRRYGG